MIRFTVGSFTAELTVATDQDYVATTSMLPPKKRGWNGSTRHSQEGDNAVCLQRHRRHTFASIAGDLGFSEQTIAGCSDTLREASPKATYIWTARSSWRPTKIARLLDGNTAVARRAQSTVKQTGAKNAA
jgi:hypothetical protein